MAALLFTFLPGRQPGAAHASPLTSGGDRPLRGSPCAPCRAQLLPMHLYWVSLLFCHRSSFVLRCYFQPLALSDVFILVRNWAGEPQSCSRMLPPRRDASQQGEMSRKSQGCSTATRDAPQDPTPAQGRAAAQHPTGKTPKAAISSS